MISLRTLLGSNLYCLPFSKFDMLVVQYLVQSAVDGYNVCIFAYGQTGSGKTFTIYGADSNPGLTPRAMSELFRIMKKDSNKFSFSLKVDSSHS